MKALRLLGVSFAAAAIGLGFAPIAHATTSTKTTTIRPTTGGWYQFNPTCEVSCVGLDTLPDLPVPVNPPLTGFPTGSIHVGYSAGVNLAQGYIGYNFSDLLKEPTAGTIDLPVDTAAADGTVQANTAHIEVCIVADPIADVNGSIDTPPAANCKHAVAMKYVAKPAEHFTANITSMLKNIVDDSGFAILPNPKTVTTTDAWEVAFKGPDQAGVKAAELPALGLTVPIGKAGTATTTGKTKVAKQPPSTIGLSPGGSVPITGTEPINLPPTQVTTTDTGGSAPQVASGAPTTATPQTESTEPVAHVIRFGYAYPVVWLLPLLFLLLIPVVGRVLTSDMSSGLAPIETSVEPDGPTPDFLT